MWTDQLAIQVAHQVPEPVRVISAVHDQPPRKPSCPFPAICQRINGKFHFRGRCGGKGASHRKTLAVRHHHPLCAFSLLGFSNASPPFLAGAKLPSMKHSCQSRRPCWSSWKMNARHRLSQTSSSSQSLKRLQQVVALGRCAGISLHLAPVFNTQRMPSNTSRSDERGLPNEFGSGRSGSIRSQTASVMNS